MPPVKADDSYLSAMPNATATRSRFRTDGTTDLGDARDVDAIFDRHGGRPHWGKHHFMTPARLEKLYPRYDLQEDAPELDPAGMFLNDHLRALFA